MQMYQEEDSDDELGWSINSIARGARVLNFCYQVSIIFLLLKIMSIFTLLSLKNVMVAVAIVWKRKWIEIN